jgi:hypothetical protein
LDGFPALRGGSGGGECAKNFTIAGLMVLSFKLAKELWEDNQSTAISDLLINCANLLQEHFVLRLRKALNFVQLMIGSKAQEK